LKTFLKINNYVAPGLNVLSSYAKPTITQISSSQVSISTNSIPPHPVGTFPNVTIQSICTYLSSNSNSIEAQVYKINTPAVAANNTSYSSATTASAIGYYFDNVVTFAASDSNFLNPLVKECLDAFGGHPDSSNVYHHHYLPPALLDWVIDYDFRVVGFMCDGFPILSPAIVKDTTTSSNRVITAKDLNVYNGIEATISFNLNGNNYSFPFAYVATYCYPYTIGQFYGTPTKMS
jgi:hypothetical protein